MKQNETCEEFFNRIDSAMPSELPSIGSEYRAHLNECKRCSSYYKASLKLAEYSESVEKVDLWQDFIHYKQAEAAPRSFIPSFSIRIAGAFAAFVLVVGLYFGLRTNLSYQASVQGYTNIIVSNNNQKVNYTAKADDEVNYESSDLEYYYEISTQI